MDGHVAFLVFAYYKQQQPTSFLLDTFQLGEVFDNPSLISSLAAYSEKRQGVGALFSSKKDVMQSSRYPDLSAASDRAPVSTLLLRVSAAANYFTINTTLMQNVPLVEVDISEKTHYHPYLPGLTR